MQGSGTEIFLPHGNGFNLNPVCHQLKMSRGALKFNHSRVGVSNLPNIKENKNWGHSESLQPVPVKSKDSHLTCLLKSVDSFEYE